LSSYAHGKGLVRLDLRGHDEIVFVAQIHTRIELRSRVFVRLDEVAQRHGERRIVGGTERIYSYRILKPRHDHCKAERIESRLKKWQIVNQRCELFVLLIGDLLELRDYFGSDGHFFILR
jgi:hypothetical protein